MAAAEHDAHTSTWRGRRVRVTCRTCGDQRVAASAVAARVCSDDGSASYHFRCPACGLLESRPMASSLVGSLRGAGVSLTRWRMPAELLEPRLGGPVTVDEVLDFHVALQGDDWFDELLRA
jgi:hypothetical protein